MCRNASTIFSCLFGQVGILLPNRRVYPRQQPRDAIDSWPCHADMEPNYDEDVNENQFLRELRKEYGSIFEQATHEGWVICVPRRGSFKETPLDEDRFRGHILIPSCDAPATKFSTLNGKEVKLENKTLIVIHDSRETCSSQLLFEETFYSEDLCKYRVWCIERPLDDTTIDLQDHVTVVTNLQEARNLIWDELVEKNLVKELELFIEEFRCNNLDLENKSLQTQRDLVASLYATGLGTLLKDVQLKDKSTASRYFLQNLKVSVETYILYALRTILPKSVSAATAIEDAHLNKIIRNLREMQLRDLGVRADLHDGVNRGKLELSRLDHVSTVLEKVECLKRAVHYVSQGASAVSSDDLLPVLIFLVIKTGLPNWMAQLAFMKQFRFSVNSIYEADEAGFLITSLEAAVEHIKSGVLADTSNTNISNVEKALEFTNNLKPESIQEKLVSYLFSCIRKGNLSEVEKLLSQNTLMSFNTTVLCHPLCTCESCEKHLARKDDSNRLMVHSTDERGFKPLHVAALWDQVTIVDFLLNHNADPNATDTEGLTALHCASVRGHQNTILLLLHANADPTIADMRYNTPLHLAADHGHEGCIKALLYFAEQMRLPLDVSPANVNGDTPLHHASKWGYAGIVEILLEYGANCRATNKRGQTPLAIAHSRFVSDLIERALSESADQNYVCHSDVRIQETLGSESLQSKNKLDIKSSNESTMQHSIDRLLSAIAEGDICLAYYYLGLEGHTKNMLTRTDYCHPLCTCDHCAPAEETFEKHNAFPLLGVNACNSNNETALHVACAAGCIEIVQLLLDAGANINVVTKSEGRTPLHLACLTNMIRIVKLLLNCATCNIDAKDCNGDTPLHIAARAGNTKLVEILIRYGANPRIRNLQGATPLQEVEREASSDAYSFAFSEIVKILKRSSCEFIGR